MQRSKFSEFSTSSANVATPDATPRFAATILVSQHDQLQPRGQMLFNLRVIACARLRLRVLVRNEVHNTSTAGQRVYLQAYTHRHPAYQHSIDDPTGGSFRQSACDPAKSRRLHFETELDVLTASTSPSQNEINQTDGVRGA